MPHHFGRSDALRGISATFLGQAVPLVLGLLTLPTITKGLGPDRFGLLALAWITIGYFSVLDLGLGRALTKAVAEARHVNELSIPTLILSTATVLLVLGILGSLLLFVFAETLTNNVLTVPQPLHTESINTFRLLAICLPAVVLSSALRGTLEAYQRFTLVNLILIPSAAATFLGPLLMLKFTRDLPHALVPLAVARTLTPILLYFALIRVMGPHARPTLALSKLPDLFRYGGWLTLSGLISPLMVTLDRYLIGASLALSAVGYYTTAVDTSTKVWVIPRAIVTVFFPIVAATIHIAPQKAARAYDKAFRLTLLLTFPVTLWIVGLTDVGLLLWLGPAFSANSSVSLRILMIGAYIYAVAHVPAEFINAAGKPKRTTVLRLLEVPLYLPLLVVLIKHLGKFLGTVNCRS